MALIPCNNRITWKTLWFSWIQNEELESMMTKDLSKKLFIHQLCLFNPTIVHFWKFYSENQALVFFFPYILSYQVHGKSELLEFTVLMVLKKCFYKQWYDFAIAVLYEPLNKWIANIFTVNMAGFCLIYCMILL